MIEETGGFSAFPPGTSVEDAKEYIFHHLTTLQLTEKACGEAAAAAGKWRDRVDLAREKGAADLALEAEREAARHEARRDALAAESAALKGQIEQMRRHIPGLAARERSIDPDLLEQELRIALGETPGDGAPETRVNRRFEEMAAGAALEALKAKMARAGNAGSTGNDDHTGTGESAP
ncbi:MAG: chromosome partitioning protein [Spirochaetaceae bacterium]|jgi:hypothetical protein|nr:chromosome partitioning protein [Spirochaetaceae bacterium]